MKLKVRDQLEKSWKWCTKSTAAAVQYAKEKQGEVLRSASRTTKPSRDGKKWKSRQWGAVTTSSNTVVVYQCVLATMQPYSSKRLCTSTPQTNQRCHHPDCWRPVLSHVTAMMSSTYTHHAMPCHARKSMTEQQTLPSMWCFYELT